MMQAGNEMEKPMKYQLSLMAVALLAFSGAVQAHATLKKSVPAANSTLAAAPSSVDLEFSEAVQITAVTLQAGDAKPQDVGPLPKTASSKIVVALPDLSAGSYTLAWRALSSDNHVMSGKIQFKVSAGAPHEGMAH
jgi:methionine-rich copper-binding protein CopC